MWKLIEAGSVTYDSYEIPIAIIHSNINALLLACNLDIVVGACSQDELHDRI